MYDRPFYVLQASTRRFTTARDATRHARRLARRFRRTYEVCQVGRYLPVAVARAPRAPRKGGHHG